MSNLWISHAETSLIGHANQGRRNNGPRPAPVQCAVINSHASEPRDNRHATSNTRNNRRAPDDEDGENGESSLEDSGHRREQIRVSQAA